MVKVARYQERDRDSVIAFIDDEDIDPAIADDLRAGRLRYPLWIAWDGEQVAGVLEGDLTKWFDTTYWPTSGEQGWICNMTVRRHRRREGIGQALVHAFALACTDVRVEYVGLMLNPVGDVDGRCAFFTACGFKPNPIDGDSRFMGAPVSDLLTALDRAPESA